MGNLIIIFLPLFTIFFFLYVLYSARKDFSESRYKLITHGKYGFIENAILGSILSTIVSGAAVIFLLDSSLIIIVVPIAILFFCSLSYVLAKNKMIKKDLNLAQKNIASSPIENVSKLHLAQVRFLKDFNISVHVLLSDILYEWKNNGEIYVHRKDDIFYVKRRKKAQFSNTYLPMPIITKDMTLRSFLGHLYKKGQNSHIGFKKYVVAKSLVYQGLLEPELWAKTEWQLTEAGRKAANEIEKIILSEENEISWFSNLNTVNEALQVEIEEKNYQPKKDKQNSFDLELVHEISEIVSLLNYSGSSSSSSSSSSYDTDFSSNSSWSDSSGNWGGDSGGSDGGD